MFSPLIVSYLFLAGTGCGAFAVAVALSWRARSSASLAKAFGRVALPVLVVSCGMVVVGSACLVLDLGRPELALAVLANPSGSVLSVGAWSLAAFAVIACALVACNVGAIPANRAIIRAIEVLGFIASATAMVYSGLFLSSIWTLPLLASPLVPVVFVCSSLSCGGGVVLLAPSLCDAPAAPLFKEVARIDGALLAVEAVALSALLVLALGDALSAPAATRLLAGDLAPAFWGALVVAGIAAPFALELALRRPNERSSAVVGVLLLVGGYSLRFCLCAAPFADVLSYL